MLTNIAFRHFVLIEEGPVCKEPAAAIGIVD